MPVKVRWLRLQNSLPKYTKMTISENALRKTLNLQDSDSNSFCWFSHRGWPIYWSALFFIVYPCQLFSQSASASFSVCWCILPQVRWCILPQVRWCILPRSTAAPPELFLPALFVRCGGGSCVARLAGEGLRIGQSEHRRGWDERLYTSLCANCKI